MHNTKHTVPIPYDVMYDLNTAWGTNNLIFFFIRQDPIFLKHTRTLKK